MLVRGLRMQEYSDALPGAMYFVVGLHLGVPMRQNELGDLIDHVIATSTKTMDDPTAMPSRIRDKLVFHSDSSDVVSLLCLRPSKSGGASSLVSGATLYNEVLRRRPDLAPLLFERYHFDWNKQDPGPGEHLRLADRQLRRRHLQHVRGHLHDLLGAGLPRGAAADARADRAAAPLDEVSYEPGIALDMDFQPGDMQWLLNYAALHSRTEFDDFPESSVGATCCGSGSSATSAGRSSTSSGATS